MIRLVIKGNAEDARKALDAHGLLTLTALDVQRDRESTGAEVSDSDEPTVVRWFVEPIAAMKGEGFPVGSLLWYNFIPDIGPAGA